MKFSNILSAVAFAGAVTAVRPSGTSICDYYTTALLGDNNAANQEKLMTLLVNTAVIGNYTQPNRNEVPGFFTPTTSNGKKVQLAFYFNGQLASSNVGKKCGEQKNFLDSGGAEPLKHSKPANSMNSKQYTLMTRLYKYFASESLLGCSIYGNTQDRYDGHGSMYVVHKHMTLNHEEISWFIKNVGLSASSFGVSDDDVSAVGDALMNMFGFRCHGRQAIPPFKPARHNSICTDCDCPKASNPDCGAYMPVVEPQQGVSGGWCKNARHKTCGGDYTG